MKPDRFAIRGRRRGGEALEFTFVLLPMFAMLLLLMDTAWAIFAKTTLQYAVRVAVRNGITLTATQVPQGSCLTDVVKSTVQQNAMGLLNGNAGLALIKVNYLLPPAANSNGAATDVSTQKNADAPGNIMQVSVQNFSLVPLMPRLYNWSQAADVNPLITSVYAADLIEPSTSPPCVGTAP